MEDNVRSWSASLRRTLLPLKRLLLQLLLLLGLYFISRCVFTCINSSYFQGLDIPGFLRLCVYALRFDLSALLVVNSLYMLLILAPVPLWRMPRWERMTQIVFLVTNLAALLFEVSDWAYFPFNLKRSAADVLDMVSRKGDFWSLLPDFLIDYWFVAAGALILGWSLFRINRFICARTPLQGASVSYARSFSLQLLLLLLAGGGAVIGIRGGLQYVPINLRNALSVTESGYVPVVLNTPFSIINTLQNRRLEPLHFYDEAELHRRYNPVQVFPAKAFRPRNVVILILESFSKEFTAVGAGKSYTPFLDSLMGKSLVCTQAYANGLRSAEGIPAVIAGIPSLMEEPFTTSIYGTNRISALPGILSGKGYASAFFHGGTNGTMSFDIFCAAAGFGKYYGRSEYGDERDYDRSWGIRDEPFLQYAAGHMSAMPQPFFATVFTLSSHPPYEVPEQYRGVLPAGDLPVYQSVAYTDLALRRFFATVCSQPWYEQTLFVITADHCSPMSGNTYYQQGMGRYAIPMLFYAPGDTTLRGYTGATTQQIDILPSVLDYLGYDKPVFAFGNSLFRPDAGRFSVNESGGVCQWVSDGYLMRTRGLDPEALYAFPADSLGQHNLLHTADTQAAARVQARFRAFMQEYRSALTGNRMTAD